MNEKDLLAAIDERNMKLSFALLAMDHAREFLLRHGKSVRGLDAEEDEWLGRIVVNLSAAMRWTKETEGIKIPPGVRTPMP